MCLLSNVVHKLRLCVIILPNNHKNYINMLYCICFSVNFFFWNLKLIVKTCKNHEINVIVFSFHRFSIYMLGTKLFLINSPWDLSIIFRNTSPAGVLRVYSTFSKINESHSYFSETHCIQLSWTLLIGWTTSGIKYKSVIGRSNRVLPMK